MICIYEQVLFLTPSCAGQTALKHKVTERRNTS